MNDAVINLATHMPRTPLRMLLPGAWREIARLRREGSATLVDAALAAGAFLSSVAHEDAAAASAAALAIPAGVYNVCDDEPLTRRDWPTRSPAPPARRALA